MYLVIIIIISFEEKINRSFLELRLDLNSPELELELKCLELELELELKLFVSSGIGIGIGIENNGIGIELKKWNWPQPWTDYLSMLGLKLNHVSKRGYRSVPSNYLNQWWNIVDLTLRNKLQWNVNRNSNIFIYGNAFQNVWETAAILSRPLCVNNWMWVTM